MSRVGKKPIALPDGVTVTVQDNVVTVKGPKGTLTRPIHPSIRVNATEKEVVCEIARTGKQSAALWGTTRAVIAGLVKGVSEGIQKKLELHGVGYRASVKGKNLELLVGFSHPVLIEAPENVTFTVEKEVVTVDGIDPVIVGQTASNIRKVRPPEPYKGKGIRYVGEHVRRKVGKVVGATA